MKLHSTLLAVSASLALAATGCLVGEVDPGDGSLPGSGTPGSGTPGSGTPGSGTPGSGDTGSVVGTPESPEVAFQAVIPAVATSCGAGGAGCHTTQSPAFVTAGDPAAVDVTAAYQLMKANKDLLYPNNAPTDPILAYGEGIHKGAQYSSEHLQAVQAWLAAELAQPVGEEQPSPLAIWSGCMDLGQFQASGMADAWADKNAQGQGDCDACHNLCADNFCASNVDTRVFEALTTSPRLMLSYFTINETGTEVIINEARLIKVGTRQDPHQLHGAFNLNDDAYQRLVNFYNQTKARVDDPNIQCQPPRFQ